MHRGLAILEILHVICETIRDEFGSYSKPTLAALARTCRTFQEPALANLWFKLEDLCPLLRCLPREAWVSLGHASSSHVSLTLTRGLTPSDFEMMQRYSQRVRVISISSKRACGVNASSLQIISLLPGPLFHNLKRLRLSGLPGENFPYLRLFFSKQLVSVSISVHKLEAAGATLINLIPTFLSPPILRHLNICLEQDILGPSVHFSPISGHYDWSALRSLSLPGPTVEDIVRIGNLPNLRHLKLVGHVHDQDEIKSPALGSFTRLRGLEIWTDPIMTARWLPLFRKAKLATLHIFSFNDSECSDEQWRELFTALKVNVDHSLQELIITFPDIHIPSLKASDILPPLHCFTELRYFSIELERNLSISYRETMELTKSWPNVTAVHFPSTRYEPEHCSKLSTLALWAKYCPKLERLHLSIDASDRDDRSDLFSRLMTPEFNTVHSSLSFLEVGTSPITHKEFVALFLLKIFPDLKDILHYGDIRRRWGRVILLISLMRASQNTSRETIEADDSQNLHHWWTDNSSNRNHSDEDSDG